MIKNSEIFEVFQITVGVGIWIIAMFLLEIKNPDVFIGISILNYILMIFIFIIPMVVGFPAVYPTIVTSLVIIIMNFIFELKSDTFLFNGIGILTFILTVIVCYHISLYRIAELSKLFEEPIDS